MHLPSQQKGALWGHKRPAFSKVEENEGEKQVTAQLRRVQGEMGWPLAQGDTVFLDKHLHTWPGPLGRGKAQLVLVGTILKGTQTFGFASKPTTGLFKTSHSQTQKWILNKVVSGQGRWDVRSRHL